MYSTLQRVDIEAHQGNYDLAIEFNLVYMSQQKNFYPECSLQRGELYNKLGKLYMENKNLKKAYLYH